MHQPTVRKVQEYHQISSTDLKERDNLEDLKVIDTNDGGCVLNASAHLLSRALVSQSVFESWCIKYSVTSSVKQTPFVCIYLFLSAPPAFVRVGYFRHSR
jgi:hypothetical protein